LQTVASRNNSDFSGFIQVRKADAHSSTSVIYGFVNGLAIIIFYVTIESIQGCIRQLVNRSVFIYFSWFGATNYAYQGLPKLTKAIPASLIAILAVLEL
jgi:SulP family sulfate permease